MNHENTDREVSSLSIKEPTKRVSSIIQGFFDSKPAGQFSWLFGEESVKAANQS